MLAPLIQHDFELIGWWWWDALEAFINDDLSPGLVQHPPAFKLLAAETAFRNFDFVQWVEPIDIHFLAMACLIANGIPKVSEVSCSSRIESLDPIV